MSTPIEEIAQQLKNLNELLCVFALDLTEASLVEARDNAGRWGEKSAWNKDVDVLSMRVNRLKRIQKRCAGKEEGQEE